MLKSVVALAVLAAAGAAQARVVTLFADNFQGETPRLSENVALTNWTVGGDVDIVGMPNPFGITCAGTCVDLDGTTGPGSIRSNSIAFAAGKLVTVKFDLSGSQRSANDDDFEFGLFFSPELGSTGGAYFLPGLSQAVEPPYLGLTSIEFFGMLVPGNAPWTTYFYSFNPTSAGSFQVRFGTGSADNIGPLLDNVRVTQGVIPEPATWAMLIAGFGLVGSAARRRRTAAAA